MILWSAPRCRSTAFLRMMVERGDFLVLHEPFSHLVDFGVADVCGAQLRSEPELIRTLLELGGRRPVFLKDTTDFHYPGVLVADRLLREATHTFMIRDPAAAIESHYRLNPNLGRDEIGFAWLYEIFDAVRRATGAAPLVLDGDDLVRAPHELVEAYCARVGIPFVAEALSWEPTMLPAWQRTGRWHTTVSASGGIADVAQESELDVAAHPVLGEFLRFHQPYYDELYALRLRN